jgi:CDP-paratose 2-epimerase
LLRDVRPDLMIHAASQPSHDLSAQRPLDDFDVNAVGTINLLDACRRHAPQAVFIFVSTNKVYGDAPNRVPLAEHATRFDFADPCHEHGIGEDFPVDGSLHSPFGVSKLAADVMVQEYARYYGLRTGVFRCGCITGPAHAGVELHGFLSYLVSVAMRGQPYTIYGYQGKQVRDQLHSADLVQSFWQFAQAPRPGEVYNLGGGKQNAASILECLAQIEQLSDKRPQLSFSDRHRLGDHICYYSDLRKFQRHYPAWRVTQTLKAIIQELIAAASS